MSIVSAILPKPNDFTTWGDWARAFTRELESILSRQGAHVETVAISKTRLPSAKKSGVIVTILDDAQVGKCQVFSDGTQWLRVSDGQAIDSAVIFPFQVVQAGGKLVYPGAPSGWLALIASGNLVITGKSPTDNSITFTVPAVDVSPSRTYSASNPNQTVTTGPPGPVAVTGFTGVAIAGAAASKKFELSVGTHFYVDDPALLSIADWIQLTIHLGAAGTVADAVVLRRRIFVNRLFAGTPFDAWDEINVSDFEITTAGATDKLTLGVCKGGLSAGNVVTMSPTAVSSDYYTHLECVEIM